MMKITKVIRIPLILYTLLIVTNGDLHNCGDSPDHRVLTCVNLNFKNTRLNDYITKDIHVLIIKECSNLEISSNYHEGNNFRQITSYSLTNNEILTINSFAFDKLENLRYLEINNNGNWATIKADTFVGLEKLEMLSMTNNSIQILEESAFDGLVDLDVLDLMFNKLTVIPSSIFKSLKHLTSLFLSHNVIEILEDNCFDGLLKLQLLDISFNNLKTINSATFNSLIKLNDLYLSHNQISRIDDTFALTNLNILYLQYNKLETVEHTFDSLSNVKGMDLSNNQIITISDKAFYNLTLLDHINLINNKGNPFSNLKFNELNKPHVVA